MKVSEVERINVNKFLRDVAMERGVRIVDGFVRSGETFEQVKRKAGIQNTRTRILDGVRILRGRFCA